MILEEHYQLLTIIASLFALKLLVDWLISGSFLTKKKSESNVELPAVSVVVCGRNESDNLLNFLPKILDQDYPEFEVVFVNDRSIDDTHLVLKAFENKYPQLKATSVKDSELHWAGKKFALTLGLKAAKYDLVLLTDADCYPVSDQWLKSMVSNFSSKHKIVLGYGAYEKRSGILNGLIRGETLMICRQYMGLARLGVPYMGVGRNLGYDKNLFFDNRGFASHQFLPSGDDDLFINEVATTKNTTFSFNSDDFTLSVPETSWREWVEQKRRHLTTSNRYSFKSVASLLLVSFSLYGFYVAMLLALTLPQGYIITIGMFIFNLISLSIQYYTPTKKTSSLELLAWIPLVEIFTLGFYPLLFIWNTVVSGNPWRNY